MGGGLAGLAAAAKLGAEGFRVDLHEARSFLGGRAASIPIRNDAGEAVRIDNCQHVLLRCCTALLDFYRRCGVDGKIRFRRTIHLVQPGGAVDTIRRDPLPAPFHLARSLLRLGCLDSNDKVSLLRCLRAVRSDRRRPDIDDITFADWLAAKGATGRAVARFWRPFTVSALNEEPDIASAAPALQVFDEGLMRSRTSYELGVPSVALDDLYSAALSGSLGPRVRVILASRVRRIDPSDPEADYYISAVPFDRVDALVPDLGIGPRLDAFSHSPITGIHLWFDRPITRLDHAMLLDRGIQWIFRKGDSYYLVVVSASRNIATRSSEEIVRHALEELADFFPDTVHAVLKMSRVIREPHATYSARPGLERQRPGTKTSLANVFLAGDWTATDWPATMEGAVRSGYRAADAVLAATKASGPGLGSRNRL